jgi:hypothetical protein
MTVIISPTDRAGQGTNRVVVDIPLGAALVGLRAGEHARFGSSTSPRRVHVIDVIGRLGERAFDPLAKRQDAPSQVVGEARGRSRETETQITHEMLPVAA